MFVCPVSLSALNGFKCLTKSQSIDRVLLIVRRKNAGLRTLLRTPWFSFPLWAWLCAPVYVS